MCTQKIIDSAGTETWQIFSRMFVIAKSIEELFTPTYRIAACVGGVFYASRSRRYIERLVATHKNKL